MHKKAKILISGGGTGGHIFPAIAIANAIKDVLTDVDIHFVGANGRMEIYNYWIMDKWFPTKINYQKYFVSC